MKRLEKRKYFRKKHPAKVTGFSEEQLKTIKNQLAVMRALENVKGEIKKKYGGRAIDRADPNVMVAIRLQRFLDKLIQEEIESRKGYIKQQKKPK